MYKKINYLSVLPHVFMIFLIWQSPAVASPRADLYQKIKKETGVSLKEAALATDGKDSAAVNRLQIYAKKTGINEIEKTFEEEIVTRQQYCKKTKSISCEETVADLKSQLDFIRELNAKSDSLEGFKKLYLNLVIYHFGIKFHVLKESLVKWDRECATQEKINTKPCQEMLYETHVLADIARDLSQVALVKSEKQAMDRELLKSVNLRVSRYEK